VGITLGTFQDFGRESHGKRQIASEDKNLVTKAQSLGSQTSKGRFAKRQKNKKASLNELDNKNEKEYKQHGATLRPVIAPSSKKS